MRKYVAAAAVAVAAALIWMPALASAHTRTISRPHKGQMDLVVVRTHNARSEYYVQRAVQSTVAQTASCPAGQLIQSYCTPPTEDNLFGAFSYNDGSTSSGPRTPTTARRWGGPVSRAASTRPRRTS